MHDDPDELEPCLIPPDPLPPRRDAATESLVDLVETAHAYLRRHKARPGSAGEAERQELLARMARVLAQTQGYPED